MKLLEIVDDIEKLAVEFAEREEHPNMLVTPDGIIELEAPVGTLGQALRVLTESMRLAWAVSLNEAWMLRQDAPAWIWQLMLQPNRPFVQSLDRVYRDECLMIYAEDEDGNFVIREWRIDAREPGGLHQTLADAGHLDVELPGRQYGGSVRGFLPRRVPA